MVKDDSDDLKEKLSNLTGIPLRIILYCIRKKQPVGVREVQRRLRLKSPSHAQYHLQRLVMLGILKQLPGNKYEISDEYQNLKSLRISVMTEVLIINGRIIPLTGLIFGLLINSIFLSLFFYFKISHLISLVYSLIIFTLISLISLIQSINIWKDFKSEK